MTYLLNANLCCTAQKYTCTKFCLCAYGLIVCAESNFGLKVKDGLVLKT